MNRAEIKNVPSKKRFAQVFEWWNALEKHQQDRSVSYLKANLSILSYPYLSFLILLLWTLTQPTKALIALIVNNFFINHFNDLPYLT